MSKISVLIARLYKAGEITPAVFARELLADEETREAARSSYSPSFWSGRGGLGGCTPGHLSSGWG